MKKSLVTALAAVAVVAGLAACDNFQNSPERKAFEAFVAKCKATPSTPDCVEYAASQKGGQ
jgi:hypothetical protein